MATTAFKKIKLGLISLSTFAILAACGDNTEQMPDTETLPDTMEETTEDPTDTGNGTDNQTGEQDATDETGDTGTDTGSDTGTGTASTGILSMDFQVSLDDAVQTFRDTFGENVNIDQIEFDDDDGQYYYEIQGWEGQNEYELEINAETADIREESTETDEDPEDDILEIENYITPEEAMNAAVEASTTDVVESWSLEIENGRPVYDIDLEGANDVDIDAETGEVI